MKKHKEDSSCSGIRNKTAFVALSHFDEMALLSGERLLVTIGLDAFESAALISSFVPDYRFLEDTGRFADGATRDGLVRTPRTTSKVSPGFTS